MDEQINNALSVHKDITVINAFLLKGLAPERTQLELTAKVAVLLGELEDELELIKEQTCKSSHIQAA